MSPFGKIWRIFASVTREGKSATGTQKKELSQIVTQYAHATKDCLYITRKDTTQKMLNKCSLRAHQRSVKFSSTFWVFHILTFKVFPCPIIEKVVNGCIIRKASIWAIISKSDIKICADFNLWEACYNAVMGPFCPWQTNIGFKHSKHRGGKIPALFSSLLHLFKHAKVMYIVYKDLLIQENNGWRSLKQRQNEKGNRCKHLTHCTQVSRTKKTALFNASHIIWDG